MASATKIEWLLDNAPNARTLASQGNLCCGTIDTWLIWQLSGGEAHITDCSNASCTTLYDAMQQRWDPNGLSILNIPESILPKVVPSSGIGATHKASGVPIAGIAGDQQAAMCGQLAFEKGDLKITLGTSAMIDINVGDFPVLSERGGYPLVQWQIGDEGHLLSRGHGRHDGSSGTMGYATA